MRRGVALTVLALLLLLVAALAIGSVLLDSATGDEPAHIASGLMKTLHGRLDFFPGQPPLMNALTAIPIVAAGYRFPDAGGREQNPWKVGRRFLYHSGNDSGRLLLLARLPTIILLIALVLTVCAFVARYSGSRTWGIAAAALTGLCPNVMAHGRLATVDLGVTFFCFAAAWLFLRLLEDRPTVATAIGLGLTSAAAALAKTSGLILGPFFVLVLASAAISRRIVSWRRLLICLAIATIAAIAAFEMTGLLLVREERASLVAKLVIPFADYIDDVHAIRDFYERGHIFPQFFLGKFSYRGGWIAYYPTAMLLKTTIPGLLFVIAGVFAGVWRRRLPFAALMSFLFVVVFLGAAMAGKLNLGVRHVLPVYPFLYAGSAIAWSSMKQGRWLARVAALLLLWHAAENAFTYPSYISYFNELIGSHRNADRYLIDSNLDWGQDLRRLDRWCHRKGIRTIAVHYFGGADLTSDLTVPVTPSKAPGPRPLPSGWFALSRHYYRLSFWPGLSPMNYDEYLARSRATYVTTIGGSINVYRVE